MGARCTALLLVCEGEFWRVQIVWPNGTVHHFGKFPSKKDVVDWIGAHSRLTKPAEEASPPSAKRVSVDLIVAPRKFVRSSISATRGTTRASLRLIAGSVAPTPPVPHPNAWGHGSHQIGGWL